MSKISRFIIWICQKFTKNEIVKIIEKLIEVVECKNPDLQPKDDFREKHPNYRDFYIDPLPPLKKHPDKIPKKDYKILLKEYRDKTGKDIKPIKPRKSTNRVSGKMICPHCNAPHIYIYFNNGKKKSQCKCKVCNRTFPVSRRINIKTKYYCPYCGHSLFTWKVRPEVTIYKCCSKNCTAKTKALNKLNQNEKKIRKKKSSQFKLIYQFREYHYNPEELMLPEPEKPIIDLTKIHNNYNVLGLVLTFYVSFAISARKTAYILREVFGYKISYQTVLNYAQAAAFYCHVFNIKNKGDIDNINPGDETYIKILGLQRYVWLFMGANSKKIISYHISDNRGSLPAIIAMKEAIRTAKSEQDVTLVTDGNPSYQASVHFLNQFAKDNDTKIKLKNVIGLENKDEESEEYREFKQMIERLNRTYKFHVRPANGFPSFNGAFSLLVLFVTHYNFLRPHMTLGYRTPVNIHGLKQIPFIQGRWTAIISSAI